MNKEELLNELSSKISSGEISREEIADLFGSRPEQSSANETKGNSHFSITKILYILGAAIVLIGIVAFVSQIWHNVGSLGRISVTLGMGLITTAIGSVLLKQKPGEYIGPIFHFIGGMLIPGGSMVTLYELDVDFSSIWPIAITFGVILLFYLLLNRVHKHPLLTFFSIANGTAFVYLLVEAITKNSYIDRENLYAYLTMVIGGSYIFLAYSFSKNWNKYLVGILCLVGSFAFLSSAFSRVLDASSRRGIGFHPWEILFFFFVFGGMFLSVKMKSGWILGVSTLFLIAHVSYITSEYFADSLGWPISLVILGFVFIGLGYGSVTINKKYIKGSA
ncbi:MAG: hypothetical protein COV29_01405 [Candidatus Yanofskybacteria bacterium CG10_big_fil_rev_8_21_14_0_10_36_16]|uniref:DUF2157 domain-containing protein n=1 Tax=Candidatus Yanofskybacteria bacterium CG10_big_fil_rev_8_21_14_0_10_36_16 TaxID=1975096 RepID=A0A2J0QAV0_9BACT|nr:MAG: hypothetical protein COV29_01405 [Candidatus Yanofskybacteria bacterium CG10_big_fil_rev_8_21_14_0_10_36_16]